MTPTPRLVVDRLQMERNLVDMAERTRRAGISLWPHTKTHKSPALARLQMELGAEGLTVATLSEAELMAAAGLGPLLLAYPVVGEERLARLQRLLERGVEVRLTVDSPEGAGALGALARHLGRDLPAYLEVDTGHHRLGLPAGTAALAPAERIAGVPGLRILGLFTHGGHAYGRTGRDLEEAARQEAEGLLHTRELLQQAGLPVGSELSAGSTPTAAFLERFPFLTMVRPGTYVFYDRNQLGTGLIDPGQVALKVKSRVLARPAADRAILDAGSKTLSSDPWAYGEGFGWIEGHPDWAIVRLSEEHAIVRIPQGDGGPAAGDILSIVPNHVCPAVNLMGRFFLRSPDGREEEWRIGGRHG